MDKSNGSKDKRVRHLLAASGLRAALTLTQSEFFIHNYSKVVHVHEPHVRLGPIARQFHKFHPTHSDMVEALRSSYWRV
eukprot:1851378-Prymnesium_polylepis.1